MNTYKMDFEGYITAEFKFDIIKIFKCHFRMHNCVVVSFRMNMIVIQTMTNPYRMPNIDTKGAIYYRNTIIINEDIRI